MTQELPFQVLEHFLQFVFAGYFVSSGPITVQLKDFDPLVDFDIPGGDDVRFARPQLFFHAACAPLVDCKTHPPTRRFRWCFSTHLSPYLSP
jgi:hypothetical protein